MKPKLRRRRKFLWVLVAASFLSWPRTTFSAEDKFCRDSVDKEACKINLNLIFEAIQQYRKQHQDTLPARLSDLTPEYIRDPKTLICPFVQKTGGLRSWGGDTRQLAPDPRTSYGYEFPPIEIPDDLWRGLPKKTWRDYKQRQVERLGKSGSMVPVVRCHIHRPRLNLAFGGHIYESELYWEENFAQLVPLEETYPMRLLSDRAGKKDVAAKDLLPRDPQASPRLIDLSEHYNGLLSDSWQGFPSNHLAQLPLGLQEFGGVLFDLRGVIQLRGGEQESHEFPFPFPQIVEGIRVHQKCSRIHILHATSFSPGSQTNVAAYVIRYADDQRREIPVVYGRQIADWWFDPKEAFEPTEAKVAWTGQNEAARAYGKSLRIYQLTWDNPLKEIEVSSIGIRSCGERSAPFLIAITVEP